MKDVTDSVAGKLFFHWWMARKRLAETRRPALTGFLSWFVLACGVLFAVQGLLLGWFTGLFAPPAWGLDFIYTLGPYVKVAGWAGGICIIFAGTGAAAAGLSMRRQGSFGAKHTVWFQATIIAVGAVLLYSGIRFSAPALILTGALDIGAGLAAGALLGLCWYTLDPLGLHWPAGHTF